MNVRHLVAQSNVDEAGLVIEPRRARHGALRAGRVWALAGEIDPRTHLNLDFPDHGLGACIVVEALAVGALVPMDGATYRLAAVSPDALFYFGAVDVDARRREWITALHERRSLLPPRRDAGGEGEHAHDAPPSFPSPTGAEGTRVRGTE